jgi:AcrR family transcriptional regulator
MKNSKIDPRIIRTKKLLMDAFINLNYNKDFKDITIKDITDAAMVNRATFYAHFYDKYDLMDAVITETIAGSIVENLNYYDRLNEETIIKIFLTLTEFHTNLNTQLSTQCRKSYESYSSKIEQKIKSELEDLFYSLLLNQQFRLDSESLKIGAAILSWGIYGASVDWQSHSSLPAEQYIKKALPFYIDLNVLKESPQKR